MVGKKSPYLIALIILFVMPYSATAASLDVHVPEGAYPNNAILVANVLVDSISNKINAVSAHLNFPTDKLSVISIQTETSIFNVWPQKPSFSNELGTIDLEGVMIGKDWSGTDGEVAEIIFKVRSAGEAKIKITSGSVLSNDGKGTNVLDVINHAAVILGVQGNSKYLLLEVDDKAEILDDQGAAILDVDAENYTQSSASAGGNSVLASIVQDNSYFFVPIVAVALLVAVLVIFVCILRRNKNLSKAIDENDQEMHKEIAKTVKILQTKEDKGTLTKEEEQILESLRKHIIDEYEHI